MEALEAGSRTVSNEPSPQQVSGRLEFRKTQRSGTADAAQIRHLLSQIETKTQRAPPPLLRGSSDLAHVRSTQQKVWWTSMKKKAFSMSFKGAQKFDAATQDEFEIMTCELKIDKAIGEGCRSRVFAGTLKATPVAVKQLRSFYDPENAEKQARLVRDLETLSNDLRHPNIVRFVGVNLCREDRTVNLVFELMSGGTLEDYFDARCNEGRVELVKRPQVLSWCIQLFEALTFLHERTTPIIHRDLKPCTLMLSSDSKTLKLRDFGVSKTADLGLSIFAKQEVAKQREIKTDLSKLAGPSRKGFTGTKRYMAPECSAGEYTPKVDIFSSALIMWFMLEGERPWEKYHGHTAHEIAKSGRRPQLRADPSRYTQGHADLIACCWAADPNARPAASEVLARLQRMQEDETLHPGRSLSCFKMRG